MKDYDQIEAMLDTYPHWMVDQFFKRAGCCTQWEVRALNGIRTLQAKQADIARDHATLGTVKVDGVDYSSDMPVQSFIIVYTCAKEKPATHHYDGARKMAIAVMKREGIWKDGI